MVDSYSFKNICFSTVVNTQDFSSNVVLSFDVILNNIASTGILESDRDKRYSFYYVPCLFLFILF